MLRGLGSLKLNPLQHSPVQYNIIQLLSTETGSVTRVQTASVYFSSSPVLLPTNYIGPIHQMDQTSSHKTTMKLKETFVKMICPGDQLGYMSLLSLLSQVLRGS